MKKGTQWLPHLEGSIPEAAYGDKICAYTIALEGWRRGLTLKFFKLQKSNKIRYSLSNGERTHRFSVTRGDKVTKEAVQICISKELTKQHLAKAGVPVPEGKSFGKEATDEEIIRYAESLGTPVVVKPRDGSKGKGVTSNIESVDELMDALHYTRQKLNIPDIIVEQYFPGDEFRVHVIGDRVIGALNRIPANVVGDGTLTIKQLIEAKNEKRRQNPAIYSSLIKLDNDVKSNIRKAGYTLDTVLEKGEQLFLTKRSNMSTGGDTVDVTDKLTPEMRTTAAAAIKAVPGLVQGGVDMIINKEDNSAVVIEINSRAGAGMHLFPVYGQARDIPKAIIDYYFPETIIDDHDNNRDMLYFDYKDVTHLLKSGKAKEVKVPAIPKYRLYARQFVVTGQIDPVTYGQWVQRKAIELKIHGYVEQLPDETISVVAAGKQERLEKFQSILEAENPSQTTIDQVTATEWSKPIQAGFEERTADIKQLQQALEAERAKVKQLEEVQNRKQREWVGKLKKEARKIVKEHHP